MSPDSRSSRLQAAIGYFIGAACLIWVLHDVHPSELARDVKGIRWSWVWLAVAFDILSYGSQGWRWRFLLRPLGCVSVFQATEAIYVGLFANEVLPLRFGELVRARMIAQRLNVDFAATLPSMAVERLFDSLWLAVAIGLTAMLMPLPVDLMRAEDIMGAVVLVVIGWFLYLILRRPPAVPSRWRPLRWLAKFSDGIQRIGRTRALYSALAVSLLMLALQALSFWLVMRGYGFGLSFWAGTAAYLVVRLGTAIPNAPANVGTYQFFTVVGLALFGVGKTAATGFSIVVFLVLTIPLWALGLVALSRSGTTLFALRREWNG